MLIAQSNTLDLNCVLLIISIIMSFISFVSESISTDELLTTSVYTDRIMNNALFNSSKYSILSSAFFPSKNCECIWSLNSLRLFRENCFGFDKIVACYYFSLSLSFCISLSLIFRIVDWITSFYIISWTVGLLSLS